MPQLLARDLLGWLSSLVLLVTIVQQLATQWRQRSGKGVSRWLFVGQGVASLGFTIYSALLGNWIFTLTNALMFLSALVGAVLTWHFKRQSAHKSPSPIAPSVRTVPSRYAR
jgi:uncharacterized protein with PQ loop repeat